MAREIPLSAGRNTLQPSKSRLDDVEDLFEISGLGTIWLGWSAAESCSVGGELAAEFGTWSLACVFIMKAAFNN
jgi:hypothetical protein